MFNFIIMFLIINQYDPHNVKITKVQMQVTKVKKWHFFINNV